MKHHIRPPMRFLGLAVLLCGLLSGLLAGNGLAAKPHFLPAASLDLAAVLPPPPADGSPRNKAELMEMLRLQRTRTPAMVAFALADVERSPFRFADVLGAAFNKQNLPGVEALFAAILEDATLQIDPAKQRWNRLRPFLLDPMIEPCLPEPQSASYPSGHSTFGHLAAIVLSAMVPEKAEALAKRGEAFARNRVIGGVHYPSDIAAGAQAAEAIAKALFNNPEFQKAFQEAKAQTRQVLGLAP
ncbi:acid phosphatase [Fundidesulfovibrio agrisoli]|uniref:acid phosphatase n=1 Tax=Fundidesulfovibrio agrisoli TaxID=2922717 RepID=UPI001FADE8AB|nr:phosphatase PAP2 family protein [Fundidesulfovibrio agrisoli]